jgi:hypothetical protein
VVENMEIYEAIGGTIVGSTLTYNYTKTQCSYINTLASSSNLIGGVQQFSLNAPDSVGFSLDACGSSTYVVKQNGLVRTDWSYCNVSILI